MPESAGSGQPSRLGGYELLGRLGKGGMGTVLKARQISLDRLVALKILPQKLAANEQFVQRFLREARSAARLRHPHIVQAIDVGQVEGYYVFAMELVDGETLDAILRRDGPLEPERALRYLKQTASALAAAHDAGLVHRDIKPSNLMVDRNDDVRVTDFGLAKRTEGDIAVTADGQTVGTPAYLAPESAKSGQADARSDLYSLGATFFCALAGRPPFEGNNFSEVLIKKVTENPPPLASLAPRCDRRLCHILDRLIRRSPDARYPSANALLDDLDGLGKLQTVAQLARAETRAGTAEAPTVRLASGSRIEREAVRARLERRSARGKRTLPLITGGVLLTAIAGFFLFRPGSETNPPQAKNPPLTSSVPAVIKPVGAPGPATKTGAPQVPSVKKQPHVEPTETAKKQPVPEPPAPRPNEWVSLFDGKTLDGWKIAEEGQFAAHGKVYAEGGQLILEPGAPQTGVVRTREFPTDGYEIAWEAQRLSGSWDFTSVIFPVGGSGCILSIGGMDNTVVGLADVDARSVDNASTKRMGLQNGRWYSLRLRVSEPRIEFWIDQEKVIDLPREGHRFIVPEAPGGPLRPFGLYSWQAKGAIRDLRVRRLDPGAAAEAPLPGEWHSLFDGKTLDGWNVATEGGFTKHGEVRVEKGEIVLGRGDWFTGIAWQREFPPSDYEVTYEAKRVQGASDFGTVVFPVGPSFCALVLGGFGEGNIVGLMFVDGGGADNNMTTVRRTFEPGRWVCVRLRATPARVQAWLDDEGVVDLATAGRRFEADSAMRRLAPFGLYSSNTVAALRNLRLRRLEAAEAEGEKIQAAELAIPAQALWCHTGILLAQRETYEITASGRWGSRAAFSYGPAGEPGREEGQLLARVGNGPTIAVGEKLSCAGPGMLFLGFRDWIDGYGDNWGSLRVAVKGPLVADKQARLLSRFTTPLARVVVSAQKDWASTGVDLRRGGLVLLAATGTWSFGGQATDANGLDAELKGLRPGMLIGRIGENGGPFAVGALHVLEALDSGKLYLRMHALAGAGANSGSLTVAIRSMPHPDRPKGP